MMSKKPAANTRMERAALAKTIGARMREAREMCNLSQSVAAKRLDYMNSSKLSKIEGATDTNSVPPLVILKASILYQVSIDFLYGRTDDWEAGARMTMERETAAWLLDTWQKARMRDMDVLRKLHNKVEAMDASAVLMLAAAEEVDAALTRFMQLNTEFDDQPGGARLLSAVGRATEAALNAKAKLKRFRVECALAAADTHQMSLSL